MTIDRPSDPVGAIVDAPGGIAIHELVPERTDLVALAVELRAVTGAELDPDDEPVGVDEYASDLFGGRARQRFRAWLAVEDGRAVGELVLALDDEPENRHVVGDEWFSVHPSHRRRGIGRALLARGLRDVADEGRTSLILFAPDLVPDAGGGFAGALGLSVRTEERCSRLVLAELAPEVSDGWLDPATVGRGRLDGYRCVALGERCPDELIDPYRVALGAMQDAPLDDLEFTITVPDLAQIRDRERIWISAGYRPVRTLVLAPDGSGAGVSELFLNTHRPRVGHQGDTGVAAAHRGRGIGRWAKATNLAAARLAEPRMAAIETWNAQSNPWMLDINVAMGFRPHHIWRGFQGEVADAVRRLAG